MFVIVESPPKAQILKFLCLVENFGVFFDFLKAKKTKKNSNEGMGKYTLYNWFIIDYFYMARWLWPTEECFIYLMHTYILF